MAPRIEAILVVIAFALAFGGAAINTFEVTLSCVPILALVLVLQDRWIRRDR